MFADLDKPLGVVHRLAFSLGIVDHLMLFDKPFLSLVGAVCWSATIDIKFSLELSL